MCYRPEKCQYIVVSESDSATLSDRVSELLADGWWLWGQMTTVSYQDQGTPYFEFSQAVVK